MHPIKISKEKALSQLLAVLVIKRKGMKNDENPGIKDKKTIIGFFSVLILLDINPINKITNEK